MNGWEPAWRHAVGLPEAVPQWLVAVLALACIFLFVVLPSGALLIYLERKLTADLQARVGPNRAGPAGIFQPIADILKLLQKQDPLAHGWRDSLWLTLQVMALYSTVAVLPLGSLVLLVDTDMSAFLPFWALLVVSLITLLMGQREKTVSGTIGGLRVASLALAAAFPALISMICAGVRAGGFKWSVLAAAQSASPLDWGAFSNPFGLVALAVFVVSGMVLLGVPPLDCGTSMRDIHGGVMAHLHGRVLSLGRLGRFYAFFLWCVIAVVLFLGGWIIPEGISTALRDAEAWRGLQLLEALVLLAKTFILIIIVTLISSVSPKVRADQVTDLAWKVLSPFSLIALAGMALWTGWRALV